MYLLFDIGGTKMKIAVSADGENLNESKIIPTPEAVPAIVSTLKNSAEILASGQPFQAICGGLRATPADKCLALGEEIKKTFKGPIFLENDTALAGLGEAQSRSEKIIAYLTISTGVGGVRIVEGKIDRRAIGFEPGHQIIDYHEPTKHWEDYISGLAVQARTGRLPQEIIEPALWQELAKIVAIGIHNMIMHWSPDLIILGGGMMKSPGFVLTEIQTELEKVSQILQPLPPLRLARLGDSGGLQGALVYLKQNLTTTTS